MELKITGLSKTYPNGVQALKNVTLEIQSYSGANVEYFWTIDGNAIPNNSNVLNINPFRYPCNHL